MASSWHLIGLLLRKQPKPTCPDLARDLKNRRAITSDSNDYYPVRTVIRPPGFPSAELPLSNPRPALTFYPFPLAWYCPASITESPGANTTHYTIITYGKAGLWKLDLLKN